MTQLPSFIEDKLWSQVSASNMRNLVAEVERMRNLSVGPGLRLTSNNSELHISLEPTSSRAPVVDVATVAVVGFADSADVGLAVHTTKQEGDNVLMIQFVDHAAIPPDSDELVLFGEPFPAYPAIGVSLDAFTGSVTTGEPTIDSSYFAARRRSTLWFVDGPGGSGGTTIAQYKFLRFLGTGETGFTLVGGVKHFHDAIVCNKYGSGGVALVADGTGAAEEFAVMLPYLLRGGPFDSQGRGIPRNGITYTRVTAQNRDAENAAGDKEEQVIVPAYVPGDRIFAAPAPALHPLSTETATLLDLNVDGRAWAEKFV